MARLEGSLVIKPAIWNFPRVTYAIKAHLWLDGPLQPEGRVTGEARRLFLDMNAIVLWLPPIGSNLDVAPTFDGPEERVSVPSLVI